MRTFITGGAGFIGSHMVAAIIDQGPLTVYDNLSSGSLDFLKDHMDHPNFNFVEGELSDLELVTKSMAGHERIIHYASNPDIARGMLETDLDIREGTLLTYNVLEAMRLTEAKEILYTSGSGIYGDVGTFPTPEDFGPLTPISFYGASKLACEGLISAFCFQYGMRGYVLRMGNVVGDHQTHGVGYDFIRKLKKNPHSLEILGDGTQGKSYVHVNDVIAAMLFVMANTSDVINIFNVATDDVLDVTSIAKIVIAEMGLSDVELAYTGGDRGWKGDVPQVRLVLDKIHELGWASKMNSAQAITASVRAMLEEV
ncbi:MAG: NAD-dependent epimerase/dehydratase family protein [Desulfarculaceae bacterium]|nr:NAD-dependent epimerase/dehydratase family protein [Desulfarculaceae bacterium]MCF8048646.1 NAD-dependent epimerase/dehydratase family protein [Desulfarculaceae bacterium]MCF8066679.1 NAD-dependent epimerase/dehydratase family protein [Desulfarculaceae bacterium]MCF8098615.1 NAD-dependent epimerase/dehydratase family protein [Desulfarculaceae bacterium]MCF8121335.1 NAD-dependent epimerase/dehydratase family protein [Desulfarculaceae bacterium]